MRSSDVHVLKKADSELVPCLVKKGDSRTARRVDLRHALQQL